MPAVGSLRPDVRAQSFTTRIRGTTHGDRLAMMRMKAALKMPWSIVLMSTARPADIS